MKKILVTAGGTATAWHFCDVANKYLKNEIELQVCDINDAYLVPAVVSAKKVHKVPLSSHPTYLSCLEEIISREKIDVIIPLIPAEASLLAPDSAFIKKLGITSTAPLLSTAKALADKEGMINTLNKLDIPTPRSFRLDEVVGSQKYILKPKMGFGSLGIKVITGNALKEEYKTDSDLEECSIEEYCHDEDYDEVTVEIFNQKDNLHIFSRRRVATKSGVCTKMVPVNNKIFYPMIKKLVDNIECPTAFNCQFLYHRGQWKLFDCNLRVGAGTALSSAIGFQLVRALLASIVGLEVNDSYFQIDSSVKSVLRVYQEIVVK